MIMKKKRHRIVQKRYPIQAMLRIDLMQTLEEARNAHLLRTGKKITKQDVIEQALKMWAKQELHMAQKKINEDANAWTPKEPA